jgi:hypothetical protein
MFPNLHPKVEVLFVLSPEVERARERSVLFDPKGVVAPIFLLFSIKHLSLWDKKL